MSGEIRSNVELENVAQQLSNGEMKDCLIRKPEVTIFGSIIRRRTDFLHFSGTAKKGGDVSFTYLAEPRS